MSQAPAALDPETTEGGGNAPGTIDWTALPQAALGATVTPGLEGVAVAEFAERLAAAGGDPGAVERLPCGVRGRVVLAVAGWTVAELLSIARTLKTVHHLFQPLYHLDLPDGGAGDLAAIRAAFGAFAMPGFDSATAFRVTTERRGQQSYRSLDVQREAGAGVVENYGAPVALENFAEELRVDVIEGKCAIDRQLTERALSLRWPQRYSQKVALKPNIAYAMLRLATHDWGQAPQRVVDPYCGSGTLLLEAGDLFPDSQLLGGDWDPRAAKGARENLIAAGFGPRVDVARRDARDLAEAYAAESVDLVCTNPPYGRQMGQDINFYGFYRGFLRGLKTILPVGGRAVFLVHRRSATAAAINREGGFAVVERRVIDASGLFLGLFVIERRR